MDTLTNFTLFTLLYLISISADIPMTPNFICLPNPPYLKSLQLSPPFSTCSKEVKKSFAERHPDQNLLTPEMLKKYGYTFETYNVTTKDDYILTVYRIKDSPNFRYKSNIRKQAVYLNHGLGGASDCWNFQPGNRNLPFKLADAGYEVWLGNARGTTYSLGHKKFCPQTDLRYWDFSWHEMGVYDVPAVTDLIIRETRNKRIFYIGHSMGTTQYFVSLSEIPEMNDKIHAGFLMSPIAYLGHSNSGFRLAAPLINTDVLHQCINIALWGRINSAQPFKTQFHLSPGDLCDLTAAKCGLCDNLVFLLFGYNPSQMNHTELPNMFAKFPNNISIKTLAHYAQIMTGCTFKKYDYGLLGNPLTYMTIIAPDYKLKKITAPTYFYYADNDNLAPPNDVDITASMLSPGVLRKKYKVQHDLFNHMDFVVAKDADKLVYDYILNEMEYYQ